MNINHSISGAPVLQYEFEFHNAIAEISQTDWDALNLDDSPFRSHAFLSALEQSGCVCANTGWQPQHLCVTADKQIIATLPCYLKTHSYGEYVFDFAWADAFHRNGLDYYPKLVAAIPFTPSVGARLNVAESLQHEYHNILCQAVDALRQHAQRHSLSSAHILFPRPDESEAWAIAGAAKRKGIQYKWQNNQYSSFDNFLAKFSSRKRKSIKKERASLAKAGVTVEMVPGSELNEDHWTQFYQYYQLTYAKRSGHSGYLNEAFFQNLGLMMPKHIQMAIASKQAQTIAAALFFTGPNTLFGRYWGCQQPIDGLHFETCYYSGIEYCIQHKLTCFDAGAQGEHKIQRGFLPEYTYSNHIIEHPSFASAIDEFLAEENEYIDERFMHALSLSPFKQDE